MDIEALIIGALRIAAEQYGKDSEASRGAPSIVEEFARLQRAAVDLANMIEERGLKTVVYSVERIHV